MDENTGSERLRIGDAERDAAVDRLREHHEAGRLSAEEFQERMTAALAARYADELPPLLADLPTAGGDAAPDQAAAPPWAWHHGPGGGPPWTRGRRLHHAVPLVPLLAVLAVVASLGALGHGHFPWPLLWIGLLLWWFRPFGRWGRSRRPWPSSWPSPGRH